MEILIIFTIGFLSSFVGTLTSGALAVVSLTLLGLYGLSPLTALAVFRVGVLGNAVGGFTTFLKANKIIWKHVLPFIMFGLPGAFIGANVVLAVDEELLGKIIGMVILLFIPLLFFKPKFGIENREVSKKRTRLGYMEYMLVSIWGGSFSVGTGILAVMQQTHAFGLTLLEIKGTNKVPGFFKSILVLLVFAYAGVVDWYLGIIFMTGMMVGSFIGAHYVLKKGDKWLRKVLLVTMFILALKLILGY